jgi:hypothetical protein
VAPTVQVMWSVVRGQDVALPRQLERGVGDAVAVPADGRPEVTRRGDVLGERVEAERDVTGVAASIRDAELDQGGPRLGWSRPAAPFERVNRSTGRPSTSPQRSGRSSSGASTAIETIEPARRLRHRR